MLITNQHTLAMRPSISLLLLTSVLLAPAGFAAPLTSLRLAESPTPLSVGIDGDRFGRNVALDGDIAAIIAPEHRDNGPPLSFGAAYFSRRVAGNWTAPQRLAIPNPDGRMQYAQSLALSGDTLVVGSYERNLMTSLPGRADVFVRSGDDFVHQATLSTPTASLAFAVSVAIDGDDLVVGDQLRERVVVYRRSAGAWTQTQELMPPDAAQGTNFGVSVAIEGDLVAIGRPYFPSFSQRPGALLLYRRPAPTAPFAFEHSYTMEGGGSMSELGFTQIDIDGERVIAGAEGYRLSGDAAPAGGAAVVLERAGGAWTAQLLLPSDPGETFDFGWGAALDGDRALLGALDRSTGHGKVYAFVRGATQWVETQRVFVGAGSNTRVTAISISGDQALVGVPAFVPTAPGMAMVFATSDLVVPDAAITLNRASAPACVFAAVVAASWSSDGSSCTAVDQGSLANSRWLQATCADPDGSCPDPFEFRTLEGSGQAHFTAAPTLSDDPQRGNVVAIECRDGAGNSVRARAKLLVTASGQCPMPTHSVAPTLSQGPLALPNGTFEMRAALTNPGAQLLSAMARHGQSGSVHARVVGNEVVLRYAPDYAAVGTQTLLTDTIGVAVDDGEYAVERSYTIQLPLRVYANGFE